MIKCSRFCRSIRAYPSCYILLCSLLIVNEYGILPLNSLWIKLSKFKPLHLMVKIYSVSDKSPTMTLLTIGFWSKMAFICIHTQYVNGSMRNIYLARINSVKLRDHRCELGDRDWATFPVGKFPAELQMHWTFRGSSSCISPFLPFCTSVKQCCRESSHCCRRYVGQAPHFPYLAQRVEFLSLPRFEQRSNHGCLDGI